MKWDAEHLEPFGIIFSRYNDEAFRDFALSKDTDQLTGELASRFARAVALVTTEPTQEDTTELLKRKCKGSCCELQALNF